MSKPRKKWRVITTFPGTLAQIVRATSEADAYRKVREIAEKVHADEDSGKLVVWVRDLTVEVNEGSRWETFESFTRAELVELHEATVVLNQPTNPTTQEPPCPTS